MGDTLNAGCWYEEFRTGHKAKILDSWLAEVEREYPQKYVTGRLKTSAGYYLQLLTDLQVSLEQHEYVGMLEQLCKYHIENATPLEHLMHSFHLWRTVIHEQLFAFRQLTHLPAEEILEMLPRIDRRIDEVQRQFCRAYWKHAISFIEQKEYTISQLHDDRLQMLGKMAASMAHEIKNPLFAIEGFLKLIRSELTSSSFDKVNGYMDVIEQEFNGLYRHISGFLSFSRNKEEAEASQTCTDTDLAESTLELVKPRLADDSIDIELSLEGIVFHVQRMAIHQVLINLINNSIDALSGTAYPKKIILRSYTDGTSKYLEVADNGEGIPAELQDSIFTPFVTGKNSGTGLGLAICKRIVELNGGRIRFHSQPGETRFILSFEENTK